MTRLSLGTTGRDVLGPRTCIAPPVERKEVSASRCAHAGALSTRGLIGHYRTEREQSPDDNPKKPLQPVAAFARTRVGNVRRPRVLANAATLAPRSGERGYVVA